VAVPITAVGAGAEAFHGELDNTDVPVRILKAMHINVTLPVLAPAEPVEKAPAAEIKTEAERKQAA
jgi:hypothetical protein